MATLKKSADEINPKTRQFLNGLLAASIEQVTTYIASLEWPKVLAILDMVDEWLDFDMSENLLGMIVDARYYERMTEKQIAWYIRELRD